MFCVIFSSTSGVGVVSHALLGFPSRREYETIAGSLQTIPSSSSVRRGFHFNDSQVLWSRHCVLSARTHDKAEISSSSPLAGMVGIIFYMMKIFGCSAQGCAGTMTMESYDENR